MSGIISSTPSTCRTSAKSYCCFEGCSSGWRFSLRWKRWLRSARFCSLPFFSNLPTSSAGNSVGSLGRSSIATKASPSFSAAVSAAFSSATCSSGCCTSSDFLDLRPRFLGLASSATTASAIAGTSFSSATVSGATAFSCSAAASVALSLLLDLRPRFLGLASSAAGTAVTMGATASVAGSALAFFSFTGSPFGATGLSALFTSALSTLTALSPEAV